MNNKLFGKPSKSVAPANTTNDAGGASYSTSDQNSLARFAVTGTFGGTFYASAEEELNRVIPLAEKVSPEFLAKCAIYGRTKGLMRSMPSYLLAVLSRRDNTLFAKAWDRVIQGPGELRDFVQVCRSGKAGRKNLGCKNPKTPGGSPRAQVNRWFAEKNTDQLFRGSIGSNPSMKDIMWLAHPKPETPEKAAFFDWVKGKEFSPDLMPQSWKDLQAYNSDPSKPLPSVPIEFLDPSKFGASGWAQFLSRASWRATLRNLAKASEAGAFNDKAVLDLVCSRLKDQNLREKSGVLPYQLMNAYLQAEAEIPNAIKKALHDSMESAAAGLPSFPFRVAVCPDVSGSMSNKVTNKASRNATTVRNVDVAGLIASVMVRRADDAAVLPFDYVIHDAKVRAGDSIITNAEKLASYGGGGTMCHMPLSFLNERNIGVDLVLYISDNESWGQYINNRGQGSRYAWTASGMVLQTQGTGMAEEWAHYKRKFPKAKLALIDLTPTTNSQILPDKDVLLIGGFSDSVWHVLRDFVDSNDSEDRFVAEINKIEL